MDTLSIRECSLIMGWRLLLEGHNKIWTPLEGRFFFTLGGFFSNTFSFFCVKAGGGGE